MTAAVPDPHEDIDWSKHRGSCRVFYAERRCTCGAVSDPRFRDPDWIYDEASGALYGPSDKPGLRVVVATEVEPKFGHLIADAMNRAAEVQARVQAAERRGYERGRRDFQFAPEGDNHHNAALCPYCSPGVQAAANQRAAERQAVLERVEALRPTIGTVYGPAILERDLRRALAQPVPGEPHA